MATLAQTSNVTIMAAQERKAAGKYLTFHLGREEYAIGVKQVREIIGLQEMTAVPQTAPYMKGVINLRGRVIPIVSLRLKLGMAEDAYTARSCIIVVDLSLDSGVVAVGLVVDGVSEVMALRREEMEDPPDFGRGRTAPYLIGMAKVKGKVKMLLDLDYVLTTDEVIVAGALAQAPGSAPLGQPEEAAA